MATQSPIKLIGISGSLRKQSYNSGTLRAVGSLLPEGITFDIADIAGLPFFNADVEQAGFPMLSKSSAPVQRRPKPSFSRCRNTISPCPGFSRTRWNGCCARPLSPRRWYRGGGVCTLRRRETESLNEKSMARSRN